MGTSPGDGVNTNHGNGTPELDGVTSDADSDLRSQFRSDNPPTVDFTRVKEVRDLDVGWISSQGANIDAAGKYENEMKAAGQPVDQDKLVEVLGGDKVHYRLTTLENGLKFVDIVRDTDGEQIYSDTEYHGLISCNCGAIHDSPAVSTPDHVRGTDIGDGFQLNMTVSGHSDTKGYASTSTCLLYTSDAADDP